MTALCPQGGTSSPKPGTAAIVVFGAGAIASLLNNRGNFWAYAVAPLIGVATYSIPSFCATDPPPFPNLTAQDYIDLTSHLDIVAQYNAAQKFRQWLSRWVWFELCQCDQNPQPTIPSPTPPPVGLPDLSRLNAPMPGSPCYTRDNTVSGGSFADQNFYLPAQRFDPITPGSSVYVTLQTGDPWQGQPGFLGYFVRLVWEDAQQNLTNIIPPVSMGFNQTQSFGPFVAPAGTAFFSTLYVGNPYYLNGPTTTLRTFTQIVCAGQTPTTSPCGPDAQTLSKLDQLLTLVTLIQRQKVPFAYLRSTTHSALSGAGEFAVQGLLGVMVTITTIPPGVGQETADPTEYFDIGWINWGTADGFTPREWLHVTPQLSFPDEPGQYTKVGYSLKPGVVVSIQELLREPS